MTNVGSTYQSIVCGATLGPLVAKALCILPQKQGHAEADPA